MSRLTRLFDSPSRFIPLGLLAVSVIPFAAMIHDSRLKDEPEPDHIVQASPSDPILPPVRPVPADVGPAPIVPKQMPKARVVESPAIVPYATKRELGYALFLDPILSSNGSRSCATCHIPTHGFASKGIPLGMDGKPLQTNHKGTSTAIRAANPNVPIESPRKAPSLINCGLATSLFADGRAASLELQAREVIGNPDEMGGTLDEALTRVSHDERYAASFRALYGRLTGFTLTNALAEYERTITVGRGRWDEYLDGKGVRPGEEIPLTASEVRGFDVFRGKGQCYQCHTGANLTDNGFHNTGIGLVHFSKEVPVTIDDAAFAESDPFGGHFLDWGRAYVTKKGKDMGKFRTPTLRGVSIHPPYMHDGSKADLAHVIQFYNEGGLRSVNRDPLIKSLGLTAREQSDLLAFINAL